MNHLDLYTGIGGFKLAAGWAGFNTIGFAEIDTWCNENALKVNWPEIKNYGDVKNIRGNQREEFSHIGLLTAGVPCQPASIIGKRKGAKDDRWLWPDTLSIIEEYEPVFVVCENPTGLLTLDGGTEFANIYERLCKAGYSVWWETIPASAAGWGHRRERVWLTAYAGSARLERYTRHEKEQRRTKQNRPVTTPPIPPVRDSPRWWQNKSPVPIVVNGLPNAAFWKQATIATGNAIVPQVAYQIIKPIAEILQT